MENMLPAMSGTRPLLAGQGFFPMKEALKNNIGTHRDRLAPKAGRHAARSLLTPYEKQQMRLRLQRLLLTPAVRVPLFWTRTVFGVAWAAPVTAFGLLLALPIVLLRGHMHIVRGHTFAILVRGRFADTMLSRHPFGAMNAMALGHVIIATHEGLSARVLMHELAHVRQASHWGIVFPLAYLASSAWAAIRGKDAYWHNRFEVAARKAEKHV